MLLHCKQSCKARFENDKDPGQICPKVSDIGHRIMDLKCIQYSICLFFWSLLKSKTDSDGSSIDYTENVIAVNAPYITTKVL